MLYCQTYSKASIHIDQPTCRPGLTLGLLVPKCLQAKCIARGVGCRAHMLLTRGTAILPWPRGGTGWVPGMRPGPNTVCCFPASCGGSRGAVGTWARLAVHCTSPEKGSQDPVAAGPSDDSRGKPLLVNLGIKSVSRKSSIVGLATEEKVRKHR